jgi:hypothetical protein
MKILINFLYGLVIFPRLAAIPFLVVFGVGIAAVVLLHLVPCMIRSSFHREERRPT